VNTLSESISVSDSEATYLVKSEIIGVAERIASLTVRTTVDAVVDSEGSSESVAKIIAQYDVAQNIIGISEITSVLTKEVIELSGSCEGVSESSSYLERALQFNSEVQGTSESNSVIREIEPLSSVVTSEAVTESQLGLDAFVRIELIGVSESNANAIASTELISEAISYSTSESNSALSIGLASSIQSLSEVICSLDIVGIIEMSSEISSLSESIADLGIDNSLLVEFIGDAEIESAIGLSIKQSVEIIGLCSIQSVLDMIIRKVPRIKDSIPQGVITDKKRIISASDPDVAGAASDTITDVHPSDGIWGQQ
jgi:hypothetical protein